jgi:hypothetical protein
MGAIRRLLNSFSASDDAFDEEARFHLEQRTNEYIRNGMSPSARERFRTS